MGHAGPPQGSPALATGPFGSSWLAPSCLSNHRHKHTSSWLPLALCLQPNTEAPGNHPWEQAALQEGTAAPRGARAREAGCRRCHRDRRHRRKLLQAPHGWQGQDLQPGAHLPGHPLNNPQGLFHGCLSGGADTAHSARDASGLARLAPHPPVLQPSPWLFTARQKGEGVFWPRFSPAAREGLPVCTRVRLGDISPPLSRSGLRLAVSLNALSKIQCSSFKKRWCWGGGGC